MADLMTGVYTYEELANLYGNFYVPAIRLYLNGKEMALDITQKIVEAEVSLSLTAASTAVLRLEGIYDKEERTFDSSIKSKFKLGTIIEVGLGYGSELTKVLKGFVAFLGAEFQGEPTLVVTIMDVRRLMMSTGIHHVLHEAVNYTDIVKKILGDYSKLCKAEIDATSDKLETPVAQNSTDYDFIAKELAGSGRTGREFFVVGDTAYFRKPRKETRSLMKVEYGRELISFQVECGYLDLKIELSGYSPKDQKRITASAAAKSGESQTTLMSKTPVSCVADPEADTQDKAATRAEALAGKQKADIQKASGVCIGLPQIVPGRFLEVVKLEEIANRKYYVTSVKHRMNSKMFVTEFETGGWT